MKMDVWVDFICPYCYVSTMTLDRALKRLGNPEIEYIHHGYLLDPDASHVPGRNHLNWMAEKFDQTVEEAQKGLDEGIGKKAHDNGVPFHPEKAVPANTKDAHLLTYLAGEKGLPRKAVVRFARAYYEEGLDLADDETLRRLSKDIGLGPDALDTVRSDPAYEQKLDDDRALFGELEIESIPHYIVNDAHLWPGSKTTDEFVEGLKKYLD